MQKHSRRSGRTCKKTEWDEAKTSPDECIADESALTDLTEIELAALIKEWSGNSAAEVHTAQKHAKAALMGALRTGNYLREVHRRFRLHGWIPWLKANCPDLAESSAYKYKKLAEKLSHVKNFSEIPNLRQAYIQVGILPADTIKEKRKEPPDLHSMSPTSGTDFRASVRSMREFCGAQFDALDVARLDENERTGLEAELTALRAMLDAALRRLKDVAAPAMVGKAVA